MIPGVVNRRKTDNAMAKRTNNDLQNTAQKTKDRATRTPLGVFSGSLEGLAVPAPLEMPIF